MVGNLYNTKFIVANMTKIIANDNQLHASCIMTTPVSVINVTHIICEQCFYTSLSVINVNNINSALTLIQA
jgi:hypothetical protein